MERKVASPAPAAPIPNPQGRIKIGSRIIFIMQPLIVPILACTAAPSDRSRYASTTFSMVGIAPQIMAHCIYAAVAPIVSALAPNKGISPTKCAAHHTRGTNAKKINNSIEAEHCGSGQRNSRTTGISSNNLLFAVSICTTLLFRCFTVQITFYPAG